MGLTWTATEQDTPEIAEGWHPADFDGISPYTKGQFGPALSWDFTAYIDGDPQRVSRLTSPSTSIKGEGYKMLTGILGRQPEVGEDIQIEDLKGRRVEVFIMDNDKGWPQVTKVRLPKKASE